MDAIREQLNKPLVVGIAAFIIGLILGLVVLGWWLWPVQYYDAAPSNLRPDLQVDYLRMAIDSFQLNPDIQTAKRRYDALGEYGPTALAEIMANPSSQSPEVIQVFSNAVTTPGTGTGLQPTQEGQQPTGQPVQPGGEQPQKGSSLVTFLILFCGLTVLLGLAVVAFFLLRGRGTGKVTPAIQAQEAARQAEWTDYSATGEESPMAQFMASYKIGDDLFDDSFSIDSPSGEFLGECGVGISETIGVGDPKKVAAFEVWLFDKNDIQTVTKVMMSEHSFNDDATRQRLAAKGEPVLAQPGNQVVLETADLRLVARIVDMAYGEGALPENSFFDNLILELAVWSK